MASLLERKLIVVTGKGGTGKSTVACALGLLAARRGLRTIVVEVGDQHRVPAMLDYAGEPATGIELELRQDLWSTSIDPDQALIEWLRALGGRISARMLAASSTFHYFAAAAPGAKELVSMTKVWELCEGVHRGKGMEPYDLVVLDAPATGHALAMLRSPQTFAAIVRMGPLAEQAQRVRELLEDPRRSGYVAVTQATEMAVSETLELEEGLRVRLARDLDAILVNGTVPRRFSKLELARILDAAQAHQLAYSTNGGDDSGAEQPSPVNAARASDTRLLHSAARTARTVYERARIQQSQIARLRRQGFAAGEPPTVLTIPFAWVPNLDLPAIETIVDQLERAESLR